ncbi:MAG: PstS family phosphate ABC transporter substrate-binding protein [Planctomycetaceae bacterium]|nr:PstS family phosphate ABC transporter substrate-binding protein [Planctomycetaceae bacterium]
MKSHGWKLLVALVAIAGVANGQGAVDPSLNPYRVPLEPVKGKIKLVGSLTMAHLGASWADNFRKLNPGVEVEIEVKGAVNAVSSVIDGDADFGMMSRTITNEEVQAFQQKFGYPPTVLTPSLEPLAIFVHKDNPIESLTLAQVDQIYSASLKRGAKATAKTWGDVGVTGEWAKMPIIPLGRSATTGSQVFMQQAVLGGGEFRADLAAAPSNLDLVQAVGSNKGAVGFAGSTNLVAEVKAVPIAWREGEQAFSIEMANYPLVRPLQFVVNHPPGKPLSNEQSEFLKYVFSQQGQQVVVIGGLLSVPSRPAQIALDAVGIHAVN